MSYFKNFKSVTYCVAQWADHISEEELRKQADWLQKYVKIDKVYLETFRDSFARKEQILMIKKVLAEYGIEVSGGITTVTPDLNAEDKKRQRLFNTFCYCNEPMRAKLKEISEYTASLFDDFIIDDFFFTQCMCEDCLKEKGDRSWEEFRLAKMKEVSKNLVIDPAKKVNPKCKVIIKYPNWRESFQETGYNPGEQRDMFDSIYTGTETRHGAQQDQHLPRYLSYSLPRYFENTAPGRNGGGWFDPYDCDRIDCYLEQAYLTAFSKCKELMMFCWPSIYNNKRATPLGFQYEKLDEIMSYCGNPKGLPVYIPFNSQGEDHLEDFLGMVGIPMEPTPDFPSLQNEPAVLVTQAALKDGEIIDKIKAYVSAGGKVIATSGFMIEALKQEKYGNGKKISELTSIRYNDKTLVADEYQTEVPGQYGRIFVNGSEIAFPLLEHRNNATWSKAVAGHGEYHEGIIMFDTYGKGIFEVINIPEMPSKIYELPAEILTSMRYEMLGSGKIWLSCGKGVSLFTYDNDVIGLYCYTNDGCAPMDIDIHVKGEAKSLKILPEVKEASPWNPAELKPLCVKEYGWKEKEKETVFHTRINPGDFKFFKIEY
ncbi:MAG: hypothetical protein MJ162_07190 [Treponema sp.]|nr:hypothetical protein [Treponema sp.]